MTQDRLMRGRTLREDEGAAPREAGAAIAGDRSAARGLAAERGTLARMQRGAVAGAR